MGFRGDFSLRKDHLEITDRQRFFALSHARRLALKVLCAEIPAINTARKLVYLFLIQ